MLVIRGREVVYRSPDGRRPLGRDDRAEDRAAEDRVARDRASVWTALDPEDWEALRRLGHRMVDDIVEHLATLEHQPVWRPVPPEARAALQAPMPVEPEGAAAAYDDFRRYVQPYPRGNLHPAFWGWVNGSGLPLGMLADLLASAMNPSVGAFENAASLVEEQVLTWLKQMLDFDPGYSAVLTSGSSMSTVIGLATARVAAGGAEVRRVGLAGLGRPLVSYTSTEAHSSVEKAFELLGFGLESVRRVPVDEDYRIDVAALDRLLAADVRSGLRPMAVVAHAGTVNTGAVDDLDAVADLCRDHDLWLHVDGAFGALAWLVPELRPRLAGLQRADSLAFDLHKWLYLPYDVGCVFVRDAAVHRAAFTTNHDYVDSMARWGMPATGFADLGLEMTRRFRALKVWLCLKAHGVAVFSEHIRANVLQARVLAERVASSRNLHLAAPVALNVVCFRFDHPALDPADADRVNERILTELWSSGLAVISDTRLAGRLVLRVAVTNHRSRQEDFDALLSAVEEIGGNCLDERHR
jgi:glutamate/tyrosine decarboxylase-like PLP-dependent enzyme